MKQRKISTEYPESSRIIQPVVESSAGSALRMTRINLSEAARKSLTTVSVNIGAASHDSVDRKK